MCELTFNDSFCIMVSLSSGSESTFWSINRGGGIYILYVYTILCKYIHTHIYSYNINR